MALKILRMFLICCLIAALLNVANFLICYYIHVNRIFNEDKWEGETEKPTTSKWESKLNTLLVCGVNTSNCPEILSDEMSDIATSNVSETTEKNNGFYLYINDAFLTNTRFCPRVPPGLGPVEIDKSIIELNALDDMFSYIKEGGIFKPEHCIPRQSVAIIIPMQYLHQSWKNYIGTFLYYIHPFLMKQLSEYQIFVIIQAGNPREPFARSKLLNTGFMEAQKMKRNGWDCLVFHDVHYIPIDTRNLYTCTRRPRRLSVTRGKPEKFGGVVSISPSVFKAVNGYSNLDWQDDGDYVNMYQRLKYNNYTIETNPSFIGKYTTLNFFQHLNLSRSSQQLNQSHATTPLHTTDGLSSLWYKVVNAGTRQLFTFIEVDFHM